MNNKAFTLLELIIVVLIIGILATWAMPQYEKFREKAIAVEAINIIRAAMKDVEIACLDASPTDVRNRIEDFNPPATEDWHFKGGGLAGTLKMGAKRLSGPYSKHTVDLVWYYGENRYEWVGKHPGVPGGPDN